MRKEPLLEYTQKWLVGHVLQHKNKITFAKKLELRGLRVTLDPLRPTVVQVDPSVDISAVQIRANVRDLAVEMDIPIRSLKRLLRSLEDMFFEATA